jgi:hypothetical protein
MEWISFQDDSLRSLGRAEARPYNAWETLAGPPSPRFFVSAYSKGLSIRGLVSADYKGVMQS